MAFPGVRVKSRLPFFTYRASVPIVECVNKYDMVGEDDVVLVVVRMVWDLRVRAMVVFLLRSTSRSRQMWKDVECELQQPEGYTGVIYNLTSQPYLQFVSGQPRGRCNLLCTCMLTS